MRACPELARNQQASHGSTIVKQEVKEVWPPGFLNKCLELRHDWCMRCVDQCWKSKSVTYRHEERATAERDYETARQVFRAIAADKPALKIGKLAVGKVLFLGNSITLHGLAPTIGWTGNWGMAASAEDKDYVHVLLSHIEKATGGKPEMKVRNIAKFERNLTAYRLPDELKEELAFEADIIVIALGENAASPKTDEAKAEFDAAFTNLFAELKKHGQPTIFVRSQFWQDAAKDRLMKKTCEAVGGTFIDISHLGIKETNYARSERQIEHAGVAGHPGDKGMQALADALWQAIQKRSELHE